MLLPLLRDCISGNDVIPKAVNYMKKGTDHVPFALSRLFTFLVL